MKSSDSWYRKIELKIRWKIIVLTMSSDVIRHVSFTSDPVAYSSEGVKISTSEMIRYCIISFRSLDTAYYKTRTYISSITK